MRLPLFDALFNILPLGSELDKADPTPAGAREDQLRWSDEAQRALETLVATKPILIRISATKRLRDAAETLARDRDEKEVSLECFESAAEVAGRAAA